MLCSKGGVNVGGAREILSAATPVAKKTRKGDQKSPESLREQLAELISKNILARLVKRQHRALMPIHIFNKSQEIVRPALHLLHNQPNVVHTTPETTMQHEMRYPTGNIGAEEAFNETTLCSNAPSKELALAAAVVETSVLETPTQDVRRVTIYKGHLRGTYYKTSTLLIIVKGGLGGGSGQETEKKRLESFSITYLDEDNDWILIGCDEDLEYCIGLLGRTTIKMTIRLITNRSP